MSLTWQQSIGLVQKHCSIFDDEKENCHLIHNEVIDDLKKMFLAAKKDGVEIAIVSSFRSFERQLSIWNDKWQGYRPVYSRHGRPLNMDAMSNIEKYKAISLWSALPGMSRHHWGTDCDIFSKQAIAQGHNVELIPEEFAENGICTTLNQWLNENLEQFGFFRPYNEYKGGVAVEPWHISHCKTSHKILEDFEYHQLKNHLIKSELCESDFIIDRLQQYKERYFENVAVNPIIKNK